MEQEILLNTYLENLYLKEDLQYMEEGIKDIMNKFTQPVLKRIMPQLFKIAASGDPTSYEKLIAKYGIKRKKITPNDIDDLTNNFPPDIQEGADFAHKVIDNSIPKASKPAKKLASYFVALFAKIKNPKSSNLLGDIKAELKVYIPKIRSFYEEVETKTTEAGKRISSEDMADIAIGLASIAVAAVLTGIAIIAGSHLLAALMAVITALKFVVPVAVFTALVVLGWNLSNRIKV